MSDPMGWFQSDWWATEDDPLDRWNGQIFSLKSRHTSKTPKVPAGFQSVRCSFFHPTIHSSNQFNWTLSFSSQFLVGCSPSQNSSFSPPFQQHFSIPPTAPFRGAARFAKPGVARRRHFGFRRGDHPEICDGGIIPMYHGGIYIYIYPLVN